MTEKASIIYSFLVENKIGKEFSAADLSEKMGEKVAPATLTSLVKQGFLLRFDTEPKTYQLNLEKKSEVIINTKSAVGSKQNTISKLFQLANTIEAEVESVIHWMSEDTYASDPGTQVGIYKITCKESNKIIYVGKTERPFSKRWSEHKKMLEEGNHHTPKLQKYFESFDKDFTKIKFEILQELPKDPKIIDLRERFWIRKYNDTILNQNKPKLK